MEKERGKQSILMRRQRKNLHEQLPQTMRFRIKVKKGPCYISTVVIVNKLDQDLNFSQFFKTLD